MSKRIDLSDLSENVIETDNNKADLNKFIVNDINKYLGTSPEYISNSINLFRIGTLVSYNLITKNRVKIKKDNGFLTRFMNDPRGQGSNDESGRRRDGREQTIERRLNPILPNEFERTEFAVRETTAGIDPFNEEIVDNIEFRDIGELEPLERNVNTREASLINSISEIESRIERRADQITRVISIIELHQLIAADQRDSSTIETFRTELNSIQERNRIIDNSLSGAIRANGEQRVGGFGEILDEINVDNIPQEFMYNWATGSSYVQKESKPLTLEEKRAEIYKMFRNQFGASPALIKGYIINNKIYTNDIDIQKDIVKSISSDQIKMILKVYILNKENIIENKIITINYRSVNGIKKNTFILPLLFKLKIISSENSSLVFGLAKEKKPYEGEFIEDWEIDTANPKKLQKSTHVVSVINKEGKKIKFLVTDCEFTNPELKGYFPLLDKTITNKSVVQIKSKCLARYGLSGNTEEAVILGIKSNPSSKAISKRCKNHRMDIVTIKLKQSERVILVHAQDLKFITNKQITNEQSSKKEKGWSDLYQILNERPEFNFR